ncbi:hypothetical protein F5Y15DRAFT_427342 [Xylariaceae sp. FL0016]|nr:hypothetical protein F5Y15DRAFT_427342 [Xylariaceae sp. FL0016]
MNLRVQLGLLVLAAKCSYGSVMYESGPHSNGTDPSTSITISGLPSYTTISSTSTVTEENCTSSSSTLTVVPSVLTSVIYTTSTNVVPSILTSVIYTTTTYVVPTTSTNIVPTTSTAIVPSTITSIIPTTSTTLVSSTVTNSAGTVNLFFWPTSNDFVYPSTYVNTDLDYTFTSPSVYMLINTIYGYNSLGRVGPSASSTIFAADLDEVSTIALDGSSATRQLTLDDLRTDCPQSEPAAVLATLAPNSYCDPILVAPDVVKTWASPCNACGRFGLFDPPYAVPTITGGLIPSTTTTATTVVTHETTPFEETTTTPAATIATSTVVPITTTAATTAETSVVSSTGTDTGLSSVTASLTSTNSGVSSSTTSAPSGVVTASATKLMGGFTGVALSVLVAFSLM